MMRSLKWLISQALEEDIDQEDITTNRTVPPEAQCHVRLIAKQTGVLSGITVFRTVFDCMKARVQHWNALADGDRFDHGDIVASFDAKARSVLTGERIAMNLVQHLSGVATLTAQYVAQVADLGVRICDTRKTTPLLRKLEKQAVVHGGGTNHRHSLFNGILVKENHIMAAGGITKAVSSMRTGAHHLMKIEVEVTNLAELEEAIDAGADAVLLDNMSLDDMRQAVQRVRAGRPVMLEASGNATLERVRSMAETGVDVISVGALTHSAPAIDLSLLIESV